MYRVKGVAESHGRPRRTSSYTSERIQREVVVSNSQVVGGYQCVTGFFRSRVDC